MTPSELEDLEAPAPDEILLCASLVDWPEVRLGTVLIGPGEGSWTDAIGRSTPATRAALATCLPPIPFWAMLAGAGRARLLAFYAKHAGRPPTTNDRAAVEHTLVYFGDLSIKKLVIEVLMVLPPAVVAVVTRNMWVQGVGRDAGGWCGTAPPRPDRRDDDAALRLLLISGASADDHVRRIVAHECGHAWAEPTPRAAEVVAHDEQIADLALMVRLANHWDLPVPQEPFTRSAAAERRAAALSTLWGYPDDGDVCARGAVRILIEEIEHRIELDRAARPEGEEPIGDA